MQWAQHIKRANEREAGRKRQSSARGGAKRARVKRQLMTRMEAWKGFVERRELLEAAFFSCLQGWHELELPVAGPPCACVLADWRAASTRGSIETARPEQASPPSASQRPRVASTSDTSTLHQPQCASTVCFKPRSMSHSKPRTPILSRCFPSSC